MVKVNTAVIRKAQQRIVKKRMPSSLKRLIPLILSVQNYHLYDPHTLMERVVRANKDYPLTDPYVLKEVNSYLKAHRYVILKEGNYDKPRVKDPFKRLRKS